MKKLITLIFLLIGAVSPSLSQALRVAVAANAQFVIGALQADFKQKTGIEMETIIGSSGKLTAQIKNGAPYDFFLSADMEFPNQLFKDGFGLTEVKEYASGSLIICSIDALDLKNWQQLLLQNKISKVAIANPSLAPYGKAAEQALLHYKLWDKVNDKLVFGESISQVNTYITTGSVSLGFTTEALIHEYRSKDKLKWERLDSKIYGKIRQGMLVLRYARNRNFEKAMKFYNYLSSASAKQLLKKYGYQVP